MAIAPRPHRRRFLAAEAVLLLCGLGLVAVFALQLRTALRDPAPSAPASAVATQRDATQQRLLAYQADVRREQARLPTLFPDAAFAQTLDLEIITNAFDLMQPPTQDSVFRVPLPGQTPQSPMTVEFFESGFVLGKAMALQRRTGQQGRLSLIMWAFATPQGAERAFRAYRDATGLPGRPSSYAPLAALKGDRRRGLEELFWVRGRLLIQSGWAMPQEDTRGVERVHDVLTRFIDARARADEAQAAPIPVVPDLSPTGRIAVTRVPDLLLPGGYSTTEFAGGSTDDAMRGWMASPTLDVRFSELGLLATHRQVIRIAGWKFARYELAAQAYPSPRRATAALAAVRADRGGRGRTIPGIGDALEVRGPGGANYTDLWWRRGPLLLRTSLYSSREAPLSPSERLRLARLLDHQARLSLAIAP